MVWLALRPSKSEPEELTSKKQRCKLKKNLIVNSKERFLWKIR